MLAAEAFAVPSADPSLRKEEAHDVLAAEAFAVPSADPSLRHRPITLPDDPSGISEPHDVLAAEEFALPAPRGSSEPVGSPLAPARRAPPPARIGASAIGSLLALIVLRRRRRRGRRA